MEAGHYERLSGDQVRCQLCPHRCVVSAGKRGRCRVRENRGGRLVALTYGRVASVAMDPIEKKPLYHFFPGRAILSVGTWGCNLSCSFCQNHTLSQQEVETEPLDPAAAVALAQARGSVGIAYTYNEPLIMWEYLRDCGQAMRAAGLKNVLVTNGFVEAEPLAEILPWIDAMNIDLKAFRDEFYKELCGGSLAPVLRCLEQASQACHVEVTTLVIPGHNDAAAELEAEATWIASHCGRQTPVHLSAYFPRYRLNARPTEAGTLIRAHEIFQRKLDFVYLGNMAADRGTDTVCHSCGEIMIERSGYRVRAAGMRADGTCSACGAQNDMVTQ